jgi:23S rRNA pseudouridine1911/1915/1917 synthase
MKPSTPSPEFVVSRKENGMTLADLIRKHLALSGKKTKNLIDQRNVFVNGKRIWMAKHACQAGDIIRTSVAAPAPKTQHLTILYRNPYLLAVDKPPGLTSDKHAQSVETLLRTQENDPALRALHRLDKTTSGVLLFTRDPQNRENYIDLFREQKITKRYRVILRGEPEKNQHTIRTRLDGQEAETNLTVLARNRSYCYAECLIPTGRTHQIRRHVQQIGCMVVGDDHYQRGETLPKIEQGIPRQLLHALDVKFTCPITAAPLHIQAPLPNDFKKALQHFGFGFTP